MTSAHSSSPRFNALIIGAGAQGRITATIWRRADPAIKLAFLDDAPALLEQCVAGIPVVGALSFLETWVADLVPVIVALGANPTRIALARRMALLRVRFANVVDPSAVVLPDVLLGVGVFIGPNAVVNIGARVGDHALINTGAIIEHDCVVEGGASISPGVQMAGRVRIGAGAFIGTGATLLPRVQVGAGAIVGAGAVVTTDLPADVVALGCPARVTRQVAPQDWARLM